MNYLPRWNKAVLTAILILMSTDLTIEDIRSIIASDQCLHSRHQERDESVIGNLTLDELLDPKATLEKVNGAALHHKGSLEIPDAAANDALEEITGFGDFNPIQAYQDGTSEVDREKRLRNSVKRLRLRSSMMTSRVTVKESESFRTMCAYRIIREMARLKGRIDSEQSLADADIWEDNDFAAFGGGPPVEGEPWDGGSLFEEPFHKARKQGMRGIIQIIVKVESTYRKPLPLEPIKGDEDMTLAFAYIAEKISDALYLYRGSTLIPDYGILGLRGLFIPELIGMIWPSRQAILSFEMLVIDEIVSRMAKYGSTFKTRAYLTSKYGFLPHESMELIHLSLKKTSDFISEDTDIQKAQTVLSLEHLYAMALEEGDTKGAISALRLRAQVTGLLTNTEDDGREDFLEGMREIEAADKRIQANKLVT